MANSREALIKKYIGGGTTPGPVQGTQAPAGNSREALIAKYKTPIAVRATKDTAPVPTVLPKPNITAPLAKPEIVQKIDYSKEPPKKVAPAPVQETIAPPKKQTFLQKVGSFLRNDKAIAEKNMAVSSLTKSINDQPYYEFGLRSGLAENLKVEYPAGTDASKFTSSDPYLHDAIVKAAKAEIARQPMVMAGLQPDQLDEKYVHDNYDALTKEFGIRTVPTNTEFLGYVATGIIPEAVLSRVLVGGAKFLPTLIKTGLGIGAFTALNEADKKVTEIVTGQPGTAAHVISDRLGLSPEAAALLEVADMVAKGGALYKVGQVTPGIAAKFLTETTIKYNLPREVYIDPVKIKSIFQTGKEISPEEMQLVTSLGLTSAEYKAAFKDGVKIKIPAQKILTIAENPRWSQLKSALGFEVAPARSIVTDIGGDKAVKAPAGLLPGGAPARPVTPGTAQIEQFSRSESGIPAPVQFALPGAVQEAFFDPMTPTLLDKINSFSQLETSAFGRKIVDQINEAIGTNLTDAGIRLPSNVDVKEVSHPDGRPAQFNEGRIELFLPEILNDLKMLSKGGKITAHDGVFTTVYELKPGESMEQLTTRYVRDIILHEAAHQKTMTLQDMEIGRMLTREMNAAKLAGDTNGQINIRNKYREHMAELETRANTYLKENYAALETEFLNGPARESQTAIQRRIIKNTKGGIPGRAPKVVTTEKKILHDKIKARAKGAREGFDAGKKTGGDEVAKNMTAYYRDMIQRLRDKQLDRVAKQSALVDYAQILPFRERGKLLKAIRNTVTEADFLKVLEQIREASKSAERRVLISKIIDELKGTIVKKKGGFPNAKFEIEAQRTLNQIRQLQKSMTYAEAQIQIAEKISTWQTQNPDGAIPLELLREVEILKTVGIKDQNVNELSYTLDAITSLKETGRTKKEIELFNRETEIQQVKDKIYDVITGGKDLPSDSISIKTRDEKAGLMRATKEFLTNHQYGWEEVLDVLSERDVSSTPYESFLSREIGDRTSKAFNQQNRAELKEIDGIGTQMKEIYGLKKNTEVLQTLGTLQEQVSLGNFRHADGVSRKLELSRGEAMQYHMWRQDETLLPTFEETLQWTPEIMETVSAMLTPADKKMAEWLLGTFYPTYYKGINEVYSKEYGVDLPYNDSYSPVHRAVDATIPENVLLAQDAAKYASAKNGSLKDRQKSRIDLKATDAFENVTRHIAKMEHYKAWSESMFLFRRIFSDKQIRQAIRDIHGPSYMKITDNFLNDFARDGVAREKVVKAVDAIRGNVARSLLGLNWKVGVKQLTGVLNYGIELPTADFVSGIADFWTSPINKARFMYDNSATLQERFGEGYERDVKYAIQKGYDKRLARANNISEALFILIRNADKFTVLQGSWSVFASKYREITGESFKFGKPADEKAVAEAIRAAENITNRIQESSRLDTLSTLQRGGSIAKLFTMLAGQPNKYLRVMMNAGRNYRAGRQSGPVAMRRLVWAWFVVPLIYNIVADQLVDEQYRSSPRGMVMKTFLGPLSTPLVTGQMFQQLYGWTQGERFTYQASPVESFMNDAQKAIEQFSAGDMVDATTYMLDLAGKLSGVPTTIVTKPIRNSRKEK